MGKFAIRCAFLPPACTARVHAQLLSSPALPLSDMTYMSQFTVSYLSTYAQAQLLARVLRACAASNPDGVAALEREFMPPAGRGPGAAAASLDVDALEAAAGRHATGGKRAIGVADGAPKVRLEGLDVGVGRRG